MSIDNLSQLKALKLFGMATALAEIRAETPRLALSRMPSRLQRVCSVAVDELERQPERAEAGRSRLVGRIE